MPVSYSIRWKKSSIKELRKIDKIAIPKVIAVINKLKKNPYPPDVKKLFGSENNYRIRVGDYRIIYSIHKTELIIEIVRVRHRKEAYR